MPQPIPGPRLTADEAASVIEHLAQLSATGLPLVSGLRAAAEELPARQAAALRDVAKGLEAGQTLDTAIAGLQQRVPANFRGLMAAGLRSGQLARVLESYLQQQRHAAQHRELWLILAYPIILISIVLGIAAFYATVVTSGLAGVYLDFGSELPAQTELLLGISKLRWPVWLGLIAIVTLPLLVDQIVCRGCMRQTLLALLPIIGPLRRWLSMAGLCRLLALLIQQHVPLPEALRLAADVVRDPLLRRDLRTVTQRVAAGQSMNEAAQGTWLPPTFAALPGWEDSSALAGESLVAAAELFESQAQTELKLLRAVAPAAAFITVLLIVGFLFSATMLPLVGIIETLT